MAEGSRGRGVFGRILAALGVAWVLWAFLGPAIGLQFGTALVDLPILPGIVILFIGRALSRGRRGDESSPQRGASTQLPAPPRPEPRVRPAPEPETSPREPLPAAEPLAVSEVMTEVFESPEPDLLVPDGMPIRKTSAEMVAEARKRFGRRP